MARPMRTDRRGTRQNGLLRALPAPFRWLLPCWVALLVMLPAAAAAKPVGTYFSTVNTYVFLEGPGQGQRAFVRARQAYPVEDMRTDADDNLWYRITLDGRQEKLNGEGWTSAQPHELVGAGQSLLRVFTRIPEGRLQGVEAHQVPATGLKLLNETQPSKDFPGVDWQKVRFTYQRPQMAWVRAVTGIYRVGLTEVFLARAYGEMVTRNLDKDKIERLLSGVVRIGDTLKEVSYAMGDPLRRQEEVVGTVQRVILEYPELRIQFENEVVAQIN